MGVGGGKCPVGERSARFALDARGARLQLLGVMFQHLRQRHAIGLQLAIGVWGAQPFGATAGVCGRRALAQCALYFGAPIIHQADMVQVQHGFRGGVFRRVVQAGYFACAVVAE